ncbi:MAG: DUF2157 domain-containing protein [Saprospiraceae bacterium]|nr:DUF2157 domain-containing protein [Saprospiraceae bacterium]
MQKKILDDLEELLAENVIDKTTAENIQRFYQDRSLEARNRQYIIFGILGSLLIGLGIILIVAHNWDNLNRLSKTVIGFLPLVLSQVLGVLTLVRWRASRTWRESAATLLVLGLGATLSLISQIYHIPGSMASFVLTWMLLILPVMYLFPSTMAAVFYLIGVTYHGIETGYNGGTSAEKYYYWIFLLPLIPHYLFLLRNQAKSNFTYLLNWLIPISILINLGTISNHNAEWLFATYMLLLGIYYLMGKNVAPFTNSLQNNGFRTLGSIGMVVLLITLSFQWIWKEMRQATLNFFSVEAVVTFALLIVCTGLIFRFRRTDKRGINLDPSPYIPILFLVLFLATRSIPVLPIVVINVTLFALALYTIRRAMQLQHLGLLNYGLLMITALIICRFFDTNISFILRGLLFVLIGIGFFIANYRMIKTSP